MTAELDTLIASNNTSIERLAEYYRERTPFVRRRLAEGTSAGLSILILSPADNALITSSQMYATPFSEGAREAGLVVICFSTGHSITSLIPHEDLEVAVEEELAIMLDCIEKTLPDMVFANSYFPWARITETGAIFLSFIESITDEKVLSIPSGCDNYIFLPLCAMIDEFVRSTGKQLGAPINFTYASQKSIPVSPRQAHYDNDFVFIGQNYAPGNFLIARRYFSEDELMGIYSLIENRPAGGDYLYLAKMIERDFPDVDRQIKTGGLNGYLRRIASICSSFYYTRIASAVYWVRKYCEANNLRFALYGFGWEHLFPGESFSMVEPEHAREIYRRSKITFQVGRATHMLTRPFIATMEGALVLFESVCGRENGVGGILDSFAPRELVFFSGHEDLCRTLEFYAHNDEARIAKVEAAQKAILERNLYRHRFASLMDSLAERFRADGGA